MFQKLELDGNNLSYDQEFFNRNLYVEKDYELKDLNRDILQTKVQRLDVCFSESLIKKISKIIQKRRSL